MLHRFAKFVAACTVILVLAGSFVTSTGSGSLGSRLADDLRLEHVHVPAFEMGRRHLLRARPSADCQHGRVPHHRARRLAVAGRITPLDEVARRRGAGRGHPSGRARRADGPVLPAGAGLDRACRARRNLLLSHDRHRALHLTVLDAAATIASTIASAAAVSRRPRPRSSTCRFSSARRCGTPTPAWPFRTSR